MAPTAPPVACAAPQVRLMDNLGITAMPPLQDTVMLASLGAVVGAVQTLTGAGGGILALPLLVLVMHWSVQTAAPVALLAVALSAGFAAAAGLLAGTVRYRAALCIAAFGAAVAPLGVGLAQQVRSEYLACLFVAIMLRNGWVVWQRYSPGRRAAQAPTHAGCACLLDPTTGRLHWTGRCALALGRTGLLVGFLSGLLGVGGGFVVVPALGKHTNLDMQNTIGTSLMVIALVALSSIAVAASGWGQGIAWATAAPFVGGAVAGALALRPVVQKLPAAWAGRGFALLSAAVALALLGKTAWALFVK